MFDERTFIARVEATDPDEFREIMAAPSREEERALRVHLGDLRYQRMHIKAVQHGGLRRGAPRDRGNVVVIHGVMGSELSVFDRGGDGDSVWVNLLRIASGRLAHLRLGDDGLSDASPGSDVRVTGILKRYYGELLLSLAENWNVRAFWFDWRKDINVAADELRAQMSGWFGDTAPVHIVAHSMGGLVARAFIRNHRRRWRAMWDPGDPRKKLPPGARGGRLVMLGTPNHGSFAIPQAIFGLDDIVQKLALLDLRHNSRELLTILNSFVGSFQMLPSPIECPDMEPLYNTRTYGNLNILEQRLAMARNQHQLLKDVVVPKRMIYIAGTNRPTYDGITDFGHLDRKESYGVTWNGDGRVPHRLGLLKTPDDREVPAWYVDEDHGGLPENHRILAALDELLTLGTTNQLASTNTAASLRGTTTRSDALARERLEAEQADDLLKLDSLLTRSRTWRTAANQRYSGSIPLRNATVDDAAAVSFASTDERLIEDNLTRGLLSSRAEHGPVKPAAAFGPTTIEIRVVGGGIEDLDKVIGGIADGDPVDAIAVGHYLGQKPEGAELALDRAISKRRPGRSGAASESDLLISQLSERGTIRGELGQTFLLPDPRVSRTANPALPAGPRDRDRRDGRAGPLRGTGTRRGLARTVLGIGPDGQAPPGNGLNWHGQGQPEPRRGRAGLDPRHQERRDRVDRGRNPATAPDHLRRARPGENPGHPAGHPR
ncbi:MAG: hypothetical protein H0V37_03180 [Chloroflexia bacterium]|nr:hypothetical protein [Chloroflexia bacterium]